MPHNTPACSQAFSQLRADLPELFSEFSREVSCEVFKKYAVKKTLMGPPGPLRAPHRSPPIPRPPPPPWPPRPPPPGTKALSHVINCKDPGFLDLLEQCLRWNPVERLTPDLALQHHWMQDSAAAGGRSAAVGSSSSGPLTSRFSTDSRVLDKQKSMPDAPQVRPTNQPT